MIEQVPRITREPQRSLAETKWSSARKSPISIAQASGARSGPSAGGRSAEWTTLQTKLNLLTSPSTGKYPDTRDNTLRFPTKCLLPGVYRSTSHLKFVHFCTCLYTLVTYLPAFVYQVTVLTPIPSRGLVALHCSSSFPRHRACIWVITLVHNQPG
jgi:hypothetical protein